MLIIPHVFEQSLFYYRKKNLDTARVVSLSPPRIGTCTLTSRGWSRCAWTWCIRPRPCWPPAWRPIFKKLTFEDVKIYGTFCSTFPQESPTKMSIVVENQCNKKYKFYHNSTTHGFPPSLDVTFRLPRRMSWKKQIWDGESFTTSSFFCANHHLSKITQA